MRALLGLGSNLPDRRDNLGRALRLLRAAGIDVREVSSVLETEPVGGDPQALYLNAVADVDAPPDPWALLAVAKAIEARMGRDPEAPRASPRVIDIDILACRGVTMSSARLTIPHPRAWRRDFVHAPVATLRDGRAWAGRLWGSAARSVTIAAKPG